MPTLPVPACDHDVHGRDPRPARPAARPGDAERLEQVEPDLAARRERRHGVDEPVQRHLAHHGDRGGVEELGDLAAR